MSSTYLAAEARSNNRLLTPEIWARFLAKRAHDPSRVGFIFDDFENVAQWADGDTVKFGVHLDTGCTVTQYTVTDLSEGEFGVMRFTQDGTDNDQVSIQWGGNSGGIVKLDPVNAGENFPVAFECRFRVSSVADTLISLFVGLAQEGCSANDGLIADAAATMADADYVGFLTDEGDGDDLMFTFHKASGTKVETHDMAALEANTWTKVGFIYDPNAPADRQIRVFVNGAEVAAGRVSNSSTNGTGDTTNFPGGEEMSPILLMKIKAGTACTMDFDWVACGQFLGDD